ncbi:MAG TPA: GntR family transcriptional regulator, partial [Thermoanaerobaculia bacterium]
VSIWRDRVTLRAGRVYAERREALLRALAEHGIAARGASGLNVWIAVAEESATVQALLQLGWAVKAGERYRIASPPAIRVTVATLDPKDARRFAEDLAKVMRPRSSGV